LKKEFGLEIPTEIPNLPWRARRDASGIYVMRQPKPARELSAALRWLGPWLVVLAISALIAHTAEAVFIPGVVTVEIVASEPAQMLPVETTGVLEHVNCAADANGEVDVLVRTLQDVELLEAGRCEVRL